MDLNKLKEPMPYQWKVQAFFPAKSEEKTSCICVGYVDARQVQDRLDEAVGQENWQCTYHAAKNSLFCSIAIKVGDAWITKEDCGAESDMEAEKGEASDAFKRAAVKWGIGRFLYDLPEMRLGVVKNGARYVPADDRGNKLFSKDQLTEYCRNVAEGSTKPAKTAKPKPADKPKSESKPDLPKMTPEQTERMRKIYNFVRDNYANGKNISPKDLAKAVYVLLGHWPDSATDEEKALNTIQIQVAPDTPAAA
jgi:hypothetical protein